MSVLPLSGDERLLLQRYFLDLRVLYAVVLLGMGLVMATTIFGQLLMIGGVVWLSAALAVGLARPADETVDQLVAREVGILAERAACLLDPADGELQAPPLAVLGPPSTASQGLAPGAARPRTGRDGRRRSPVHGVLILLPMEGQLGVYACDQSALSGEVTNALVEVHRYRDIVSMELAEASGSGAHDPRRLAFGLTNGRRVAVLVEAAWQVPRPGDEAIGLQDLGQALAAISALRRDHL